MSSYKDTFEANTFEANTFACGTWRGTGVAVTTVNPPTEGVDTPLRAPALNDYIPIQSAAGSDYLPISRRTY